MDNILKKEIGIFVSEVYCQKHQKKLIFTRIIFNNNSSVEVGYCSKCQKQYCEFSDINPVYISNYEWLY